MPTLKLPAVQATPARSIRRCFRITRCLAVLCLAVATMAVVDAAGTSAASAAEAQGIVVRPAAVELNGNYSRSQLLVTAATEASTIVGRSTDLTAAAEYSSSDEKVVTVTPGGQLRAEGDGTATVTVQAGGHSRDVAVTVAGVVPNPVIDYDLLVQPILSRHGCNMGACHASQYGKGGFKLSVFSFQPANDHAAIVRDRRQRRINFLTPEDSLLLKKPTMEVPHGGSRRLRRGSTDYNALVSWIAAGAPGPSSKSPKVTRLEVTPQERVAVPGETQQLQVIAHYSDDSHRDVTALTQFDSMDEALLSVNEDGLVQVLGRGQAPVMVRFGDFAEICTFVVPYADSIELAGWENQNFVDELASAKFRELGIEPSAVCDDATFIRRAFLDAIGTLPKPEEVTAFMEDKSPKKREHLIDRLLGLTGDPEQDIYNDAFAAWWTLRWSDLIRNSSKKVGEQGMWALHNWIRESFRVNRPFDEFVRELVTAKGSIYSSGPANYFRINGNASDLTESTTQLFMGLRLQCAKCHHHPFEKYSQADYQGFSRFFSRVGNKNSQEFGLFGRETVVVVRATGKTTGTPLGGEPVGHPLDLRIPLAEWLTSPENTYFARSVVNRHMSWLLGRGLVEPVDDLRETNPATNTALMQALSQDFVSSGYNLKHLIRTIMVSRLYQLSSVPTAANAADDRFYSHFRVKRLPAEVLLDGIDQVTGTQTKFKSLPMGTRAIELPDAEYPNYFLTVFAKPKRASVCECERSPDENLAQALHTLNGDLLATRIASANGRVATLLKEKVEHPEIIRQLYLAALCRLPSDAEQAACAEFLKASPSPKECYEDILWALINSKQFLFVR